MPVSDELRSPGNATAPFTLPATAAEKADIPGRPSLAGTPAVFQVLWILPHLIEAIQVSIFVEFAKGVPDAPTWRSQDIFTMHTKGVHALLNYALPAVIYLPAGQGIAARISGRSPCCVNPNL
ncbi:hypothetical protein [Streptomyces platensis]|uniref:hypothetical protein n=1 Tax=Streptomyces platensis TaxID=58346 RepID=UPI0036A762DC